MGLFGNRRNRRRLGALSDGLEGIAVIRASETVGEMQSRDGSTGPLDFGLNIAGTRAYWLTLEVRVPGREPYEMTGRFDVPRKAENVSFLSTANKLQPGLELPVRVGADNPESVAVDWDRFLDAPGRRAAVKSAKEAGQRTQVAKQIAKNPKMQAKMFANNRMAVQAWVGAVQAGQMSRAEFEKTVTGEVESGRMDPADAEAARATLGPAGP